MKPIIKFSNFGFQYNAQNQPTLYDINFSISKGEKILIAGPSGCGKSTLVHCMNGLIPFSYKGQMSGSLSLCEKETKDMSLFEISKHVGTVLQDSDSQFVGLTVAEDIAFALENDCIGEPALHDRVSEVAKLVNIQDFLHHAPSELSGGQKQRVGLAGVLVDDVEVLLFDEPLANLDPATGKQAIELIDNLQKETGVAVVIVEHRLEDVLYRNVDRIVLMQKGRIVADMHPDELLCTNLLTEAGIREPLYVTALKYAGVELTKANRLSSIKTLYIDEKAKDKVKNWYQANKREEEKKVRRNLLSTRNLVFSYPNGKRAIDDVSINIDEGDMVAIVGTNGAGKSTFSKLVCGFENESSGTIMFEGEDIRDYSIKQRADRIGYVMQNPNQMISKVMIYDEVALGLRSRGVEEESVKEKVEQTLKVCGLWPFRNWPISALSFGQKKRVTIASILTLEPRMLILDEPTAGQDYRHYTDICEFLLKLNHKGITVVMITHDMHLMLEYARFAYVFSNGRVIAEESCSKILTDLSIVEKASLKETSLYDLSKLVRIASEADFVDCFIQYERQVLKKDE